MFNLIFNFEQFDCFRLGLEVKKEENFSEWYSQVMITRRFFINFISPPFSLLIFNCVFGPIIVFFEYR